MIKPKQAMIIKRSFAIEDKNVRIAVSKTHRNQDIYGWNCNGIRIVIGSLVGQDCTELFISKNDAIDLVKQLQECIND